MRIAWNKRTARRTVMAGAAALLAVAAIVLDVSTIDGVSMEDTFHDGDTVITARLAPLAWIPMLRHRVLGKGSVVVSYDPRRENRLVVKRIMATGGDRVRIGSGGRLSINDRPTQELGTVKVFAQKWPADDDSTSSLTIPRDEYFLLSDNRITGLDSRVFGPVTDHDVIGVVLWILRRRS